jgi:hypothetical protein
MEETIIPAKPKGFFLIETNGNNKFIEINPARPMYCTNYFSENFNENIHLHRIREHLEKYNMEDIMVKTVINGKYNYGHINLSKKITLEKPLIHQINVFLSAMQSYPRNIDVVEAQKEYLLEKGLEKSKADSIADWFENSKEQLAIMQEHEILNELRRILKKANHKKPK